MGFYIDMHCHILPGVDDGAEDEKTTLEMLRMAYDEGIRVIVATPHHHPKRGMARPAELKESLVKARDLAKRVGEDLRIIPGMEVYFTHDILEESGRSSLKTMGKSHYLLVEFSPGDDFTYIRQGLMQVQMKGYLPILAHVERYGCMVDHSEYVEELVDMGILIQVNAGSITGVSGRKIRKFIHGLMKEELVHLVGTDAHNTGSRSPQMRESAEYVEKKFGAEYMRKIFFENGSRVLKDLRL